MRKGMYEEAILENAKRLSDRAPEKEPKAVAVEFCAALGDKECTFEGLGAAEQARHPILDYLEVDPYFDFIRADTRYTELLRRLNLPL